MLQFTLEMRKFSFSDVTTKSVGGKALSNGLCQLLKLSLLPTLSCETDHKAIRMNSGALGDGRNKIHSTLGL